MKAKQNVLCAGAVVAGALVVTPLLADKLPKSGEGAKPSTTEAVKESSEPGQKVAIAPPKPITEEIRKGLAYLAKVQNKDGGWGQGGGWRLGRKGGGRVNPAQAEDRSDVGNTCIAMLSILRFGADLRTGQYAENLRKGADFLMTHIEKNGQDDSLFVTHVRDTQLQSKIGRYVDTFLAAQMLAELKGMMLTPEAEKRRSDLLDKVIVKIGKHQQDNGAIKGNGGWASVLSQGLCSRGLNAARLAGAKVTDEMLEKDANQNAEGIDIDKATITAVAGAPSSAGVNLYTQSSKLRGLQENWVVNKRRRIGLDAVVASQDASQEQKEAAKQELKKIDAADKAKNAALGAVEKSLKDQRFVNGFGNNGGEEFLSYMNLSESLRAKGGKVWADWDKKIGDTINHAQNEDGSWSGHHCITGRNFCTAGALLTLMADRAPVPQPEPGDKTAVSKVAK